MISWDTLLNMQSTFTFAQNEIDQMTPLVANVDIYSLPKTNITYQHHLFITYSQNGPPFVDLLFISGVNRNLLT